MTDREILLNQAQTNTANELAGLKFQLEKTKTDLERSQAIIAWMETSKFWKLRAKVIKLKQKLKTVLSVTPKTLHLPETPLHTSKSLLPVTHTLKVPQQPTVLIVGEMSLPQCLRYRINQKIEQLQFINYKVSSVSWHDYFSAYQQLHFCHIVIFYRVPAFPETIQLINYANHLKKIVFFDIDDLIFDLDSYNLIIKSLQQQLSTQEISGLINGTTLYREAMSLCKYAIASTPTLGKKMAEVVGTGNYYIHRNGLDSIINSYLEFKLTKIPKDYISIFYGSGTKTHDADFQIVSSSLVEILVKHPNVRLTLIGYLNLPNILLPYADRIDRINFLQIEPYFEFLSQADINIAPLESGLFPDCKSEIKWLEAALLKVPSVVSATQTYIEVVEDGVDVFLATTTQDWFDKLDTLVSYQDLRHRMAEQAYNKAKIKYNPITLADNLKSIFNDAIERSTIEGTVVLEDRDKRKKLLFVNVLYPPQGLGGATVVMKNIVDTLKTKREDYDLYVFTCDIKNPQPYQLTEYTQDGVHVTSLSVGVNADVDWRYQDAAVYETFKQYLNFHCPDLIHFHSIQRLTASPLVAAKELGIPYIVTVHDAWWLGDRQFLMDKDGNECDPQLNNPLIAARYTENINNSILRRRYLAKYLNQATALLAVSNFQAEQYRKNGFNQIRINSNGIKSQPPLPRTIVSPHKVRLGFAGGICTHKGYYFLKLAILSAGLRNTELTVIIVDLDVIEGSVRQEKWGSTPVKFISKLPPEKMPDFFSNIDVLLAPSLWTESFGLITREAVQAGVWVVAANKGGLAEDIRPGIDGDVFSPEGIDELVAILQRIDREPDKYHQSVPPANDIKTIEQQVTELEKLYDEILNK
jgi:glycosyltransferase involved in cell wall biosynthesis